MDMENQRTIKDLADKYGAENLVVVMGATDLDSIEINAETMTVGDPSFSGPLAGTPLGLRVYHILEPELKAMIPQDLYQERVGMIEMITDPDRIGQTLRKMRGDS